VLLVRANLLRCPTTGNSLYSVSIRGQDENVGSMDAIEANDAPRDMV
jgi:hypothetical protein